jgi:hypothetical protein
LFQLADSLFGDARVGAAETGLRARITLIDAPDQRLALAAADIGMAVEHLLGVHRDFLL